MVSGFRVEAMLASGGGVRVYRAHDEQLDRAVVLRVAEGASGAVLLEDARRLAAVSSPGLVTVLGAGSIEAGSYAAVADVSARPLSEVGALSSDQAARVAIEIAGAIGALADAGLRAPVTPGAVVVDQTNGFLRAWLDPLRAAPAGASCFTEADAAASTTELLDLIERAVPAPSDELHRAIEGLRSDVSTGPDDLLQALSPLSLPRQPSARGRRRWLAAAAVAGVVAIGVALVLYASGGSPRPAPSSRTPGARVVARIPLGLTGQEEPISVAFATHAVWVATTAGRLLRIDPATNQAVGGPIKVAGHHPFSSMVSDDGALYTTDDAGWLLRIDPHTGRVTGRRRFGERLTNSVAEGSGLWLTAAKGQRGFVLRVDARTLRQIGTPLNALPNPGVIQVQGQRAWVGGHTLAGDFEAVRLNAASGERSKTVLVGDLPVGLVLDGSTLWIPDLFDATVSALNANRMVFSRPAFLARRSPAAVLAVDRDLWVSTYSGLESGRVRVERFDSRSERQIGSTVNLGVSAHLITMAHGLGSLWVSTATDLVRLAATTPPPALTPASRLGPSPRALEPGPLAAGAWRTTAFVAPFTFSTPSPAFSWHASYPLSDLVSLTATRDRPDELAILAPHQIFLTDQALRTVGSPLQVLNVLRHNRRVRVGSVQHIVLGGRPALQLELRTRHADSNPSVCGPARCVLLFPVQDATISLGPADVSRVSLLQSSGHTLVILESGENRRVFAATAALLQTIHFEP